MKLSQAFIKELNNNWNCNPTTNIGDKIIVLHSINGNNYKINKIVTVIGKNCDEFITKDENDNKEPVVQGDQWVLVSRNIKVAILKLEAKSIDDEIKDLEQYKTEDMKLAEKIYDIFFVKTTKKKTLVKLEEVIDLIRN